jgi:hypothetical protein
MKFRPCLALNICVLPIILLSLLMSQMAYAQAPIVTHDELKQALVTSANARKENLAQVRAFFSSHVARKALASSNLNFDRVQKAVSTLNADELAQLAVQTRHIQNDFAAGALTNQQITYILIALATAVVVLIAVR